MTFEILYDAALYFSVFPLHLTYIHNTLHVLCNIKLLVSFLNCDILAVHINRYNAMNNEENEK